jgi:NAD(P)-dependent dehydrogenase (short-subunit alcohol dehydrogenase family)
VDLTDWAATTAALAPLPTMDGLVNNAAVAICTPLLQVTEGEFDL